MSSLDGGCRRLERRGEWGRVKGWKSLKKKKVLTFQEKEKYKRRRDRLLFQSFSPSSSSSSSASASERRQHSSDNSFGFLSHKKRCGKEEEILKVEGGEEEGKKSWREGKKGSGPAETNKQNQVWVDGMNRTAEDWRRFERSSLAQEQATHATGEGKSFPPLLRASPSMPAMLRTGRARPGEARESREGHGNRGTLRGDWTMAGMAKCPSWPGGPGRFVMGRHLDCLGLVLGSVAQEDPQKQQQQLEQQQ